MLKTLGRSVYLTQFEEQRASLSAFAAGGAPVFISLHISEEFDAAYCARVQEMCDFLSAQGWRILADVSEKTIRQFGCADLTALAKRLHLWGLRLDYGFSVEEMCALAQQLPVAVNASTTTPEVARQLAAGGGTVIAMHNFYPRPETGLDPEFLRESTAALQAEGLQVYGFIPGDALLRGPLYAGLPTLEAHRTAAPSAAFADLALNYGLDGIFAGKPFEKKKGQRKTSLAQQIEKKGLEPFVSGVSLGADSKVDAPKVNAQFCIRGTGREAEVVEKMYFDRLLDFVYVEFMKGLQKGFVPKRCANCGRWFLQTPGATFAYCAGPAPEDPGKTCREIGAASSFKDKVANNEVWQVQQRAYKKYYARTMRKDMTKAEFEAWTRDAEQKRDAALEPYARAESEEERQRIAAELEEKLNRL